MLELNSRDLLVAQKDLILNRINDGAWESAAGMLAVVRELWCANNYGYKYTEVYTRLLTEMQERDGRAYSEHLLRK